MLKEPPPREVFFDMPDIPAFLDALPSDVRPPIEIAFINAWRIKKELLPLQWSHVDLREGVMRLDAGTTKNGEARVFHFQNFPRVVSILRQQREITSALEREQGRIIPYVFHRNGDPIKDFRGAFDTAVKKIGLPHKVPHDMRKTGVRHLIRAGVTEGVAMKISGHKTRSVFDRYNITSTKDVQDAAEKLAAFHDREAGSRTVLPLPKAAGGRENQNPESSRRVKAGANRAGMQGRR